ncbi:hypothetical protein ACET3Z_031032 [Daucus carota]
MGPTTRADKSFSTLHEKFVFKLALYVAFCAAFTVDHSLLRSTNETNTRVLFVNYFPRHLKHQYIALPFFFHANNEQVAGQTFVHKVFDDLPIRTNMEG